MTGAWRAEGRNGDMELCRAQFILANRAVISLYFSSCAMETTEEFKVGE